MEISWRMRSLVAGLVLLLCISTALPAVAQGGTWREGFDDSTMSGWDHSSDVRVDAGILVMQGPGFAMHPGEWEDMLLTLVLQKPVDGEVAISYQVSPAGSYHLVIGRDYLAVQREVGETVVGLSGTHQPFSADSWVTVGVQVEGHEQVVTVNGTRVLTATDPDSLPPGGIAIENLNESTVEVDSLTVATGLAPSGTDTTALEGESAMLPVPEGCQIEDDITVCRDLVYATFDYSAEGHELRLDLYLPVRVAQPYPLVIFIHGGGWMEGGRDICPYASFARHGFAMACVDYRLASSFAGCPEELTFPAQIFDVKAAVRWLRQVADLYGLDSGHFGALGNSSGGHLAALLGTSSGVTALEGTANPGYSDSVQAVVDWFGPVDITQGPVVFDDDPCVTSLDDLNATYGGESTPFFYWTWAWSTFLGGSLADPAVLAQAVLATPLTYIDADDPPFLVMHGELDGMVPITQSELLANALQAAGVDVTFLRLPDLGHGFLDPAGEVVLEAFLDPTLAFLDEHLRPD